MTIETDIKPAEKIWEEFLVVVKAEVNLQSFKTWFEPIKPVKFENNELVVQVTSHFFWEWLEEHYYSLIHSTLDKIIGAGAKFTYILSSDDAEESMMPFQAPVQSVPATEKNIVYSNISLAVNSVEPMAYQKTFLNQRYTFANYIKGESNQLARAAANAVSNDPGGTSFNPLVIYGGTGLGKTHLIQAIGNAAIESGKAKRVMYVSSERFTNEFIDAIHNNKANDFTSYYRSMDILIVDDIQFFSGKESTQDSFFHTFNTLHQLGKQIVLSSDRPPKDLRGLDDRLISRFQWGLTADIQPPDLETRTAILRKRCEDDNVSIPPDVIDFVAANVTSNVRELEGCYTRILFESTFGGKEINTDLARHVLRSIVSEVKSPLTVEEIQRIVGEFFNLPVDILRAKTRKQEVVGARQIAMYLAKELTNCSLKTIGLHFGGRDHSTVIHAYQTVEDQVRLDSKFKTSVDQIRKKIELTAR
mgnify:CR=1 FL=1